MTVDATRPLRGATPARVLLVDDDEVDIESTRRALEVSGYPLRLDVVKSGEDALAYLRQEGKFEGRPTPDLVLLDVKMPGISGIDTFRAIKRDPRTGWIPIVMITASTHDEDMLRGYTEQAHGYLIKPIDIDILKSIVKGLGIPDPSCDPH